MPDLHPYTFASTPEEMKLPKRAENNWARVFSIDWKSRNGEAAAGFRRTGLITKSFLNFLVLSC